MENMVYSDNDGDKPLTKTALHMKYNRAYAQGEGSYASGIGLEDCPYHKNDVGVVTERCGWLYGWLTAKRRRCAREDSAT